MKSGELSIVAGVYLLTLAYMTDMLEWIVAGGLLLIFGVVLMCVEGIPKQEKQGFLTLPDPSFSRPKPKKPVEEPWICTACGKPMGQENGDWSCFNCNRFVRGDKEKIKEMRT